jgi:hypothetical protein
VLIRLRSSITLRRVGGFFPGNRDRRGTTNQSRAGVPCRRTRHHHPQGTRLHYHLRCPRRLNTTTRSAFIAGSWNRPPQRSVIRCTAMPTRVSPA